MSLIIRGANRLYWLPAPLRATHRSSLLRNVRGDLVGFRPYLLARRKKDEETR